MNMWRDREKEEESVRECVERHTERGEIEMEDESVKESAWRDRQKKEESETQREGEDRNGGRKRERECVER